MSGHWNLDDIAAWKAANDLCQHICKCALSNAFTDRDFFFDGLIREAFEVPARIAASRIGDDVDSPLQCLSDASQMLARMGASIDLASQCRRMPDAEAESLSDEIQQTARLVEEEIKQLRNAGKRRTA